MREAEFPAGLLAEALKRARQAPYYRGRFPDRDELTVERWRKLPRTTKDDLRAAYPFGFLGVPRNRLATYHESSGSSGRPISSFFTESDWTDIHTRFLRSRVGLTNADLVLVKTPYSLVTTALQMHGAARHAGAAVVPADNRSQLMPYARVLRLLRELGVSVTWSLPSEALIWAHLVRRQGLDPAADFPALRALVVAGEALSPAKKAFLSRVWGGKAVIEDYGSTETGSLAGECEQGELHIWGDRIHFELVGDDGNPSAVEAGLRPATRVNEGSLVVTPLYREGMPLVRYDLEDQARLSPGCPCGSPHPRIEVRGRRSSRIDLGTVILYPKELEALIYGSQSGVWFWRARRQGGGLELEVCGEQVDAGRLREFLQERCGIRAEVREAPFGAFVPEHWLAEEPVMQKPRYVYQEGESWGESLAYY